MPIKNIAFAGTPDFAKQTLQVLYEAGFNIDCVLTQPDKPAGRNMQLQQSAVKQFALAHHLPLFQSISLNPQKDASSEQLWQRVQQLDALIVVAYGCLLPKRWVDNLLCINVHASLLPKWRGAAPIQRAIQNGDSETGISLMKMDEGLDTGDIIAMQSLPIHTQHSGQLFNELAAMGADLLLKTLNDINKNHSIDYTPQNHNLATYAHKIQKSELLIDLNQPAQQILQSMRAFYPQSICIEHAGQIYKIWQAKLSNSVSRTVGMCVFDKNNGQILLCCQDVCLEVLELQAPNKKRMSALDFLNGYTPAPTV